MGPLAQLRAELDRVNAKLLRATLSSSKSMERLAGEIEHRFGNGIAPQKDLIATATRQFHRSGHIESFRDAKLICYGISAEILPDRTSLLCAPELVGKLLDAVERFGPQSRKFRRCFQALMMAYFEYRPTPSEEGTHRSWMAIQRFLRVGVPSISHEPMPEWARKVLEHRNLFDEDPCERYGKEVLSGNVSRVRETFTAIGIARNSWLQVDIFIAAVRVACNSDDQHFIRYIDDLLSLLRENPAIQIWGVKYIIERYVRISPCREHTALRISAVNLLGNPLLVSNAPRWEGVSPDARRMVSDWIKLKLIEQFFELLSHDGATDSRRLRFWAEYVSLIENVWFVLGSGARGNVNPDFKKLRQLMGDQALNLEGATYGNNAFVMKIGKLIVVEFGETGNAAYLFDERNLPFTFEGTLHLRDDLKNRRNLGNLKHVDGHDKWENRFRQAIRDHTGVRDAAWGNGETSQQPTRHGRVEQEISRRVGRPLRDSEFERLFKAFCTDRGLRFLDERTKRGKLTVYANADNPKISGTLGQWGFKFNRNTRTWTKDS